MLMFLYRACNLTQSSPVLSMLPQMTEFHLFSEYPTCIPQFLHPLTSQWSRTLFPCLGYFSIARDVEVPIAVSLASHFLSFGYTSRNQTEQSLSVALLLVFRGISIQISLKERTRLHSYQHGTEVPILDIHASTCYLWYLFIYLFIYLCVCVCARPCMCVLGC